MKKRNVLIAVLIVIVLGISSISFARGTSSGSGYRHWQILKDLFKGSEKNCCPIDDLPSRIAGDPGPVSGTWTTYTDAANATDGDFSTFASGENETLTGDPAIGYVTWDMGSTYDISFVTVKAGLTNVTGDVMLHVQGSRDNASWAPAARNNLSSQDDSISGLPLLKTHGDTAQTEQTFLMQRPSRYIRIRLNTVSTVGANIGTIRLYEIKVR